MARPYNAKITELFYDCREFSSAAAQQLRSVLDVFGIKVYDDPRTQGGDMYGFILSDQELTPEQVAEWAEDAS